MKLEVGKYYKNRDGKIVKIVKFEEDEEFYRCKYRTYTPHGSYSINGTSLYDLIVEVIPVPAYRVKAEQKDTRDFIRAMESEKGEIYTKFELLKDSVKLVRLGTYTYYATQVDAGYIDPITGEFVMNESKKLKLEIGKTYKTRGGEIVKIVSGDDFDDSYPFRGDGGATYTEEGLRYDWIADHESNLVEEVIVPTQKPKLRLEVGKTYRDGYGDLHKIVSNKGNPIYHEHTFWSEERSYTVEGFWQMDKEVHKYNLIEEVEVKTTTTKKEQPMSVKYYRTTEKNTESHFPLGTIVTLYNDDGSQMPRYKDVNSVKYQYLFTDRLEEINVKTVKTIISPASKLVKILEDSGYKVESDGNWRHPDKETFASKMFCFCGLNPSGSWNWLPEWLEEKVVFDSTVNTFNARQFIVDFMKKKRELSHEAYLYQRDIDEVENEWSDAECEKVANRILRQVEIDFTSSCCPFCIKFTGDCDNCSYGKRHGVCSDDDSDFGKYINPVTYNRAWPELLDFVNNYPGARK